MNNRVLLTNILLIALFLFQGCVSSANRIKAENFAKENNFDAAVEFYNKACQDDPDNLDLKLKLNNFKQQASLQHMRKALSFIDKKYFREAIEELQISIAFYSSNHRAIELVDKVKMMKESFYYTEKGNKQIKTGDFENAKKSILSKLSGINFIFDKDIKSSKVTLFMTDVKFDRFLDVLLKTNALKAKMINRKTMLIYPNTPAKAKEYDELYVKTFYLSYLKAKKAVGILTKILKILHLN